MRIMPQPYPRRENKRTEKLRLSLLRTRLTRNLVVLGSIICQSHLPVKVESLQNLSSLKSRRLETMPRTWLMALTKSLGLERSERIIISTTTRRWGRRSVKRQVIWASPLAGWHLAKETTSRSSLTSINQEQPTRKAIQSLERPLISNLKSRTRIAFNINHSCQCSSHQTSRGSWTSIQ